MPAAQPDLRRLSFDGLHPNEAGSALLPLLSFREIRSRGLLRRAAFAGETIDVDAALRAACAGRTTLPELDLEAWIPGSLRARIEAAAPRSLRVPSGRRVALDYAADSGVSAAVKLQELFGLAETPRLGPRAVPVTFVLLAPNGRPVQTTRDLRSFWNGTYPEVRRELRGRYPKHPWPEDPWTAPPTRRTIRRPKS